MQINGIVYKVTSPSGKVYIGITTQGFEKRKQEHVYAAMSGKRKGTFQKAYIKYKDDLVWEIIDRASTEKELIELEKYYIQFFDSYEKGYNLTLGGESNFGWKPSEDTKRKISKSNKGQKRSDETKKKCSESAKKRPKRILSEKTKLLMAKSAGCKTFEAINVTTLESAGFWNSQSECSRKLNVSFQMISKILNKKDHHVKSKGYTFKYIEEVYIAQI